MFQQMTPPNFFPFILYVPSGNKKLVVHWETSPATDPMAWHISRNTYMCLSAVVYRLIVVWLSMFCHHCFPTSLSFALAVQGHGIARHFCGVDNTPNSFCTFIMQWSFIWGLLICKIPITGGKRFFP